MLTRLAAALLVLAAIVVPVLPARADNDPPVGGRSLAGDEVVVHREPGVPDLPGVSASSYVIADLKSGKILAAKDPHGRYRPASTLKVLTAITLLPRLDRDQRVRPTASTANVEGSKVGLVPGKPYRVDDLFQGLLVDSGNDAAMALAQAAGGLDRTLALMNAEADRLHAYDTVAKTPHGLDRPGQRSSAYDLALFARQGLRMPAFRDYVSTVKARFPAPGEKEPYPIHNHNDLLTEYAGGIGVKTGYTDEAGATYIGAATRNGRTILVTMMHSEPAFWTDAEALLDWGFAAADQAEPVGTLVEPARRDTAASGAPARSVLTDSAGVGDRVRILAVSGLLAVAVTAVLLLRRRAPRYRGRRRRGDPSSSPSHLPF